jgi:aspartyl-tRNA(Asn)/glutamyl-tRNA(Gln) amidotransferase subunit B
MTTETPTKYEVVIGIEVHAQLATKSKMFCSCATDYHSAPPNTYVCPVCLGMPGMLPVINKQAVEFTIMTGLALNCTIPERAKFDRKNYPYPDLPKGYQISQYDLPLCKGGWIEVEVDGETKRIGITRVHLEEDTARSMHRSNGVEDYSLVDFNRSGTPLMEIVTEPDVRSGKEARAYVTKLQQILRYVGASRANLEEGNMRCEPNISLRPAGRVEFGTKVELKNLNSFRAVELGIDFEIARQSKLLDAGERVMQETRGWRDDSGETVSQRSKEAAEDYRYFPEPDLPPVGITPAYVEELRAKLPELPDAKRQRFVSEYGLNDYEANLLTETQDRADYYEVAAMEDRSLAKGVANLIINDVAKWERETGTPFAESKLRPADVLEAQAILSGRFDVSANATVVKAALGESFKTGVSPLAYIREQGLTQISSSDELTGMVAKVIEANPKPVADYRGGKESALKALVGLVMRETRGRANPQLAEELLRQQLDSGS